MESILRGLGIDRIAVADPTDVQAFSDLIHEALTMTGIHVVIARRECELIRMYKNRFQEIAPAPVRINPEKCKGEKCMVCLREFPCPGLMYFHEAATTRINEAVCTRCGDCIQICPFDAIEQPEISDV